MALLHDLVISEVMELEEGEILDDVGDNMPIYYSSECVDEKTGEDLEQDCHGQAVNSNGRAIAAHVGPKRQEEVSFPKTPKSRLLDEMRREASESDNDEMDVSECEDEGIYASRRMRKRVKFDSECVRGRATKSDDSECVQDKFDSERVQDKVIKSDGPTEKTENGESKQSRRRFRQRGGRKHSKKKQARSDLVMRGKGYAAQRQEEYVRRCLAGGLLCAKPLQVTVEDPPEEVGCQIAKRMKEPNVNLIKHISRTVGSERAIRLLKDTENSISQGGILTSDGQRRRTAGGTFLTLLKSCKYITEAEKEEVFAEEKRMAKEAKKRLTDERKQYLKNTAANLSKNCRVAAVNQN